MGWSSTAHLSSKMRTSLVKSGEDGGDNKTEFNGVVNFYEIQTSVIMVFYAL